MRTKARSDFGASDLLTSLCISNDLISSEIIGCFHFGLEFQGVRYQRSVTFDRADLTNRYINN